MEYYIKVLVKSKGIPCIFILKENIQCIIKYVDKQIEVNLAVCWVLNYINFVSNSIGEMTDPIFLIAWYSCLNTQNLLRSWL